MTDRLTREQWRTLDELLRDPEVESKGFVLGEHYDAEYERAERYREALEEIAKKDYAGPLPESVRIARRALRGPEQDGDHWRPEIGEEVWLNYPDGRKLGNVTGYVPEGQRRAGQPIIKSSPAEPLSVIHPRFLIPFRYGGPEWQRARAEGRIRGLPARDSRND